MLHTTSLLVLACSLCTPAFALQAAPVFVVDDTPGTGADFEALDQAAQIVPPGSILLVRDGTYGGARIDRPLTLVSENGSAGVEVTGLLEILDVPFDGAVDVIGLSFSAESEGVRVLNASGPARLADLDLTATAFGEDGLQVGPRIVARIANLKLDRVRIGGDAGEPPLLQEGPAFKGGPAAPARLELESASVNIYDSTITGLPGRDAFEEAVLLLPVPATAGGAGIGFQSGGCYARVENTVVTGGAGGAGLRTFTTGCFPPLDGGSAVLISAGFGSSVTDLDSEFFGGAAGAPVTGSVPFECPATAAAGSPFEQLPATGFATFSNDQDRPGLAMPAVLREGSSAQVVIDGPAGDMAWWVASLSPSLNLPTSFDLVPEVSLPYLLSPLGVLPGGGSLTLDVPPLGDLVPVGLGLELYSQALTRDAQGVLYSGEFVTTVLLDAAQ